MYFIFEYLKEQDETTNVDAGSEIYNQNTDENTDEEDTGEEDQPGNFGQGGITGEYDTYGLSNQPGEIPQNQRFNAIKKYLIYQKIRDVQYLLDNPSFIQKVKDKDLLEKFADFIDQVVNFYHLLTYDEALEISQKIIFGLKKLK